MRAHSALVIFFLLVCCPALFGQISADQLRRDRERERAIEVDMERRMFNMRALEGRMRNNSKKDQPAPVVPGEPILTAETKQRIIAARKIRPSDAERYAVFLQRKHTGIVKLVPDRACLTYAVVRVAGDCATSIPQSADLSFRDIGYVAKDYRDLGIEGDAFVTAGFFSQGILVSLGDAAIENLEIRRPEIGALASVPAPKTPAEARQFAKDLAKGRSESGFRIASSLPAKVGETYALRAIGYRLANSLPPPSGRSTMSELKFLSLGLDRRDDVIVVFRVVDQSENGGMTIVWQELQRKDAPALKFAKGEAIRDLASPE